VRGLAIGLAAAKRAEEISFWQSTDSTMKTFFHILERAPRTDRQILAVTFGSSVLLLTLSLAAQLIAA